MKDIKRLLLVDDDNHVNELLSIYLLSEGFLVNTSTNVYDALAFIKYDQPDLIISDIMMNKLNGYDFIKVLKKDENLFHIPVIFLTVKGMTDDRVRGYNLGCHAYLSKPFNPIELLSIIKNILRNLNCVNCKKKYYTFTDIYNDFVVSLTFKEKKILLLLIKGCMNKEIAKELNLSLRNIEKYISKFLRKTNTRNRTELAKFLIDHDFNL